MSTVQTPALCHYLAQMLFTFCSYLYVWSTLCMRKLITLNSQRRESYTKIVSTQKADFLKEYGNEYGYPDGPTSVDELRSIEFARLQGTVYLDHAGATLYTEHQLKSVLFDFSKQVYGNPHSQSASSVLTSDVVEAARAQVLAFCNASAEEYSCVFTSGATAALKIVGETFPWTDDSQYMYAMENHNSVLGIREYALDMGATVTPVDITFSASETRGEIGAAKPENISVRTRSSQRRKDSAAPSYKCSEGQPVYNLFAFPQECNFSGARFDLGLIPHVQQGLHADSQRGKWLVLLDAAKGCSSSPPDLHRFPADFVALSFYKIFGYPTGLGALLVRKGASKLMRKKYFGGGTVSVSIADADFVQRRPRVDEWLEDGTTSFLSIAALHHGFDIVSRLQMAAIRRHTGSLTCYTASKLAALRHKNGNRVCTLYGNHLPSRKLKKNYWDPRSDQGPVIAFNLQRADKSWVGYREVEKLASLKRIHLRTGCFCNPGACAKYLGLSTVDMKANFEAGHVCWDDNDLINSRPVGAVRVSFGYMSTFEDCWTFLNFISTYYVESHTESPVTPQEKIGNGDSSELKCSGDTSVFVQSIFVYPIKSCSGFTAKRWPVGDCGLLYDREWLIKSRSGEVLTQKKCPRMWSIKTQIDLDKGSLHVESPNMKEGIDIPLSAVAGCESSSSVPLCANPAGASTCGPDVARWFSQALNIPCNLIRREAKSRFSRARRSAFAGADTKDKEEERTELSFANEGQFLLVSQSSVDDLNLRLTADRSPPESNRKDKQQSQADVRRFRPNLVVVGSKAYDEDDWEMLAIGDERFKVRGGCNRCIMVNIDQITGEREALGEPLATLASYRRFKGMINFGILLEHEKDAGDWRPSSQSDGQSRDVDVNDGHLVKLSYSRVLEVGERVRVLRTSSVSSVERDS